MSASSIRSSSRGRRGPRRGTLLQGAVGPPARCAHDPDVPRPGEPRQMRAVATPWKLRCWRRRRWWSGRRFVPPGKRPSTGVAARKGRERPRPRITPAVPRSSSGVAHAPRVSVDDVLGRVCEVPVQSDRERRAFPEKTASRINADSVPDSASLLPLGRTRSAGCASAARCCQRFGIDRDAAHETQGVRTLIRS